MGKLSDREQSTCKHPVNHETLLVTLGLRAADDQDREHISLCRPLAFLSLPNSKERCEEEVRSRKSMYTVMLSVKQWWDLGIT